MRTIWFTLVAIGFSPPLAFAQFAQPTAPSPRFFLGGGIMSDGDNTWGATQRSAGLTALAGVDLSRHVVRLTFDLPKVATTTTTDTYRNANGPVRSVVQRRHRSISWSVIVEGHGQVSDRISIGLGGGMTVAPRPTEIDISVDELATDGALMGHTDYHWNDRFA
jgi:hypothetical protein